MIIQEAIDRLNTRDAYGNLTGYTGDYQEVLDTAQRGLEAWQKIEKLLIEGRKNIGKKRLENYVVYFTYGSLEHLLKEIEGK